MARGINYDAISVETVPIPTSDRRRCSDIDRTTAYENHEIHDIAVEDPGSADWKVGDVILDLYEITGFLGEGGMGRVYKARHRKWCIDLAIKTPRHEIIAAVGGAEDFAREADTWVNLGFHPQVVCCYYVRILDDVPRLFVEYVEGGTLSEWIRTERLYTGTRSEALVRILDVGVQAAWGLIHAHKRGLIHQDVKPANVMMAPRGRVKVTDFGLARARALSGTAMVPSMHGQTLVVDGAGMFTPAYASPEQIAGKPLSSRTDIWSWAGTVVEMFAGGMYWASGHLLGEFLESMLENWSKDEIAPHPPTRVIDLLRKCFAKNPESRPETMAEVAAVLIEEYQRLTHKPYPREEIKRSPITADSLNNRAVSLLDLGNPERALELWDRALRVQPYHPEVSYNRGLILWRSKRLEEIRLVTEMEEVLESAPDNRRMNFLLGLIHMERGDYVEAEKLFAAVPEGDELRAEVAPFLQNARESVSRSRRLLTSMEGHADSVLSVHVSEDGLLVLSGSEDFTLALWEIATGRCVCTFSGHTGAVVSVSLFGEDRFAFSASKDGTFKIWDVASGECLRTIQAEAARSVDAATVSRDGRTAVAASGIGPLLTVWDLDAGECLHSLNPESLANMLLPMDPEKQERKDRLHGGEQESPVCISLSRDDNYALTALGGDTALLWDTTSWKPLRVLLGHAGVITSLHLSEIGNLAISGSADTTLRVWDTASGSCLLTLKGQAGTVSSVRLSSDERWAVSGNSEGTVKLWDLKTQRCVRTFMSARSVVTSVDMTRFGEYAVTGSRDGNVKVWNLCSDLPEFQAPLKISRIQSVERALSARTAYDNEVKLAQETLERGDAESSARHIRKARSLTGYRRHPEALEVWENISLRLHKKAFSEGWRGALLEGHSATVNAVCITPDRRYGLSGSNDGKLILWDLVQTNLARVFHPGHVKPITSVSVTRDGRYALTGSGDHTLKLWDVARGDCVRTFEGHGGPVLSSCLSHDGRYALSGSLDKTMRLWKVDSGDSVRIFSEELHLPVAVCLSQDGRYAISGGWDKKLKLWNIANGKCVRTLADSRHLPICICLSHDGRSALSGGTGGNRGHIWIWDVAGGRNIGVLEGHTDLVHSVCLTSDSRYALSGSWDGTIKLWDVADRKCLRTFMSHFGMVFSVALSRDGMYALSGGDNKAVSLWILDWELEGKNSVDWGDAIECYLRIFLTRHAPYAEQMPSYGFFGKILAFLARQWRGPSWSKEDFRDLMHQLQCAGFGGLQEDEVKRRLKDMASGWDGPADLPSLD